MDVRPVLRAGDQALAAVEARDADLAGALAQLAAWDGEGLHVPRIVIGVGSPPDSALVEGELSSRGIPGARLAIALAEGALDADGMRAALEAVRARTGAVAIVADFGSGAHPDVDFLVDYPADALALSPRLVAGVAERAEVAERVAETCRVTGELGWRVIAADVGSQAEREALAAAGVAEVAGPAIAPFVAPGELGAQLSGLGATIPAGPEPSARVAAPSQAAVPATPAGPQRETPWSREAEGERPPRLARPSAQKPAATSISTALPEEKRGSPGRSRPPRGQEANERGRRGAGARIAWAIVLLLVLAAIAYVVLAYLGHVPDPLGIEDIEI